MTPPPLHIWPPYLGPEPEFAPRSVANALDAGIRRIGLYLHVGDYGRVAMELRRLDLAVRCLRANYPAAAIERGPV